MVNVKAPHACPQVLFMAPLGTQRRGVQMPVLTSVRLPSVRRLGASGWLEPGLRFYCPGRHPNLLRCAEDAKNDGRCYCSVQHKAKRYARQRLGSGVSASR